MAILFDKQTQKYYFPIGQKCSECARIFHKDDHGLVKVLFNNKQTKIFCQKCVPKSKKYNSDMSSMFVAIATGKLPDKAIVVDEKYSAPLKNSNIDVWDIGKLDSPVTDHTRYAGKEEFSKMELPDRPTLIQIDQAKKKPLKDDQLDDFFTGTKVKE